MGNELEGLPLAFPKAVQMPKKDRIKDRTHLGKIKSLPCVICENFGFPVMAPPSDAHHTRCGNYGDRRRIDRRTIPLCKGHHRGDESDKVPFHGQRKTWVELYGPDTDYIEMTLERIADASALG